MYCAGAAPAAEDDVKMHRTLMAFVILFVGALNVSPQEAAPTAVAVVSYEDPDAYAVYSVLLASQTKEKLFVILSEMQYDPDVNESSIKGGPKFTKAWCAALANYVVKFRQVRTLAPDFQLDVPYRLVASSDINALFTGQMEEGWKNFAAQYPGARGFYYFSAVGFDKKKTHAIVQMNNSCGGFCAYSRPHFLEKNGGKWREVEVDAEYSVQGS
jgi:hypothetical protein